MLSSLITSVVDISRRFALAVVALSLLATLGLGWFAATHFKINTDINQLLSDDLAWRKQEKALAKAFPQNVDNLVIVVDGKNAGRNGDGRHQTRCGFAGDAAALHNR